MTCKTFFLSKEEKKTENNYIDKKDFINIIYCFRSVWHWINTIKKNFQVPDMF